MYIYNYIYIYIFIFTFTEFVIDIVTCFIQFFIFAVSPARFYKNCNKLNTI